MQIINNINDNSKSEIANYLKYGEPVDTSYPPGSHFGRARIDTKQFLVQFWTKGRATEGQTILWSGGSGEGKRRRRRRGNVQDNWFLEFVGQEAQVLLHHLQDTR
jgi:hypothetical protein